MFGIFRSKKYEPLNNELRKWFENSLLWLEEEFPEPKVEDRKIFLPTADNMPFIWNNDEDSVQKALKMVAGCMAIPESELELDFYETGITEINSGYNPIFLNNESDQVAGLYYEKDERGKYTIALDKQFVNSPEHAIAIIAHELSHVKLLGEKRIEENDEHLTDLATVLFGFGIFCANTSFQYYQSSSGWGYSYQGYMNQDEWAYSLALLAYMRNEEKPDWANVLNPTLKKDFDRSLKYILDNEDEIFKFDPEPDK
ncbi:MAG: hypothetical protein LBT43_16900 [Prevotella sp.]|jgi:hypothetical protein|nr:hypothetical protein [Prevotella sp.]